MTAWVVRGGASGEDERFGLDNGVATVAWDEIGDLTGCHSREDVRAMVDEANPGDSAPKRAALTGQLWAFRRSIRPGDIVVMPLKTKPGYLAMGECSGEYFYDAEAPEGVVRHRLPVAWQETRVSKVGIKDDLLYSLNAIRTVFSPSRNNAEARLRELMRNGTDPGGATGAPSGAGTPVVVEEGDEAVSDPSPAPTLDAIRDRIRGRLDEDFKAHKLTGLVADILEVMGFRCEVSEPGPDGGVDILAGMGPLGLDSPTLIVEVKSETGAVGAGVVRGLHSAMNQYAADQALLVALGGITKPAEREFAQLRTKLRVWDADALLDRLFETYDRLPAATRAKLPLKMAWVLDDEQE